MAGYILLFYSNHGQLDHLTPEEMQRLAADFGAWANQMRTEGRFVGGNRLRNDVRSVAASAGRAVVTDGPYAESKEIVGGYFNITAASFDEACAVAAACPSLKYGARVEVRQIFA